MSELALRDVEPGDVDLYAGLRCDPVVMAELGGPLPRDGIDAKVERDVAAARSGESLIKVVEVGGVAAGNIVMWQHDQGDGALTEVGWMVLPAFQGRGVAKAGVRLLLRAAAAAGWKGPYHAFPGASNGPSNGICRSLGFTLLGQRDVDFSGRVLHANHWQLLTPGVEIS